MREVIIYHGEDDYWIVECPSLPGCISQGKTKESAIPCAGEKPAFYARKKSRKFTRAQYIDNIKEAIEGYIDALREDGLIVPEEKFETMVVAV